MPHEQRDWDRTKREPNTVDDWCDLHIAIEWYRRRRMARHLGLPLPALTIEDVPEEIRAEIRRKVVGK